jgi:cytochrome c-type biogenesis protein CcmH
MGRGASLQPCQPQVGCLLKSFEGEALAQSRIVMVLWVALACVTAAALAAILRPLGAASPAASNGSADIAIYRDQLAEIAAEQERGLLGEAEASAARAEIGRRLLASDDRARMPARAVPAPGAEPAQSSAVAPHMAWLAYSVAALVPLCALVLYLSYGSPSLHDHPLGAQRTRDVDQSSVSTLIAAVEAQLRKVPDDGQGWDVIAPLYLRIGRYADAAHAFGRAAQLLGQSISRLAGFAESTTMAANGIVTEEARKAYEKLAELAPSRHEPRFWLALALEQDGNVAGAAAAYKALLDAARADASWRGMVQERYDSMIARLPPDTTLPTPKPMPKAAETEPKASTGDTAGTTSPPTERGPTAADVAAAGDLSAAERSAMIEQMVSGLASRLKTDGRDLRGWQRLIRAYVVLGRTDEAKTALAEARAKLGDDAAAQSELARLAQSLGLGP